MKISLSGNKIIITPREKGIVLVIDRSDEQISQVVKSIYDEIQAVAKEYNVTFKLGALSWKDELYDISDLGQVDMEKRGRFITPLVEVFFKDIKTKEYDLLILSSGMIYDYADWEEFLLSKFNNIYSINVKEELKTKIPSILKKNLISKLFGEVIEEVMINFDSQSVPYRFPENFLLQFDLDKKIFSLKYPKIKDREYTPPKKMNIEIHTRGYQDISSFKIMIGDSQFDGMIRNDEFSQPTYIYLSKNDLEIFRSHIKDLQQGNTEGKKTYCPLCEKKETFYKPFFCQDKRRYILELLDNLAQEKQKRFLFINNKDCIVSSPNEILEYNEGQYIFVNEKQVVYKIISEKGNFKVEELSKIFRSLYKLEDRGLVLLWS